MTIYQGSRYEDETIVTLLDTSGVPQTTVVDDISRLPASFVYNIYSTKQGDRIDQIAMRFLGDPEQWWAIADANPQRIFWDNLPPNTPLRIPNGLPS